MPRYMFEFTLIMILSWIFGVGVCPFFLFCYNPMCCFVYILPPLSNIYNLFPFGQVREDFLLLDSVSTKPSFQQSVN
jgi:hypothetical protein